MPAISRHNRLFVCSLAITGCFATAAAAQQTATKEKVEQILRETHKGQSLSEVAVSPDGRLLAMVAYKGAGRSIELAPLNDLGKKVLLDETKKSAAQCNESGVSWAPDSKRLAFKSDCHSQNQENIFLATLTGDAALGNPKIEIARLTEAKGEVGDAVFSPDGSKIGFLYVEGATRAAGALAAMKPWSGVIGEDGVEIQRAGYVDASAQKAVPPTFVTPASLHVYEFDWSPDAKSLAYIAANPPGENNWWVAKLYTQKLGGEAQAIFAPAEASGGMHGLQMAIPRWSPSGKSIAFIGGLMSDQGSTGGDVWLVPAAGGDAKDLTEGRAASPAWIEWGDEAHLFVSETVGGDTRLVRLPVGGSDAEATIYRIPGSPADGRFELSLSSTSDRSTFIFVASSFNKPGEVYTASTSGPAASGFSGLRQLTHLNDGIEDVRGKTESLSWKSDAFNVQGWLHLPRPYDPAKKYPLLVLVHGGPAAAVLSAWNSWGSQNWAVYTAMGYFVLEPNPRGSYGQGEAFTAANRKDFGYGDLRDILAGVDTVLAKYPVDPERVGLLGWSYGGFMTMFGVTQTNRFKAAYAGAGISNWQSYYGENSIDQWMTPYFGASVYKDPAVYAKSSAINFIDKVKTPTLVVVGDRDGECPAPQSFEFWHALRDQHVPTQLVIYPNEGHGFVDWNHRTDLLVRGLAWFAKYMPATK